MHYFILNVKVFIMGDITKREYEEHVRKEMYKEGFSPSVRDKYEGILFGDDKKKVSKRDVGKLWKEIEKHPGKYNVAGKKAQVEKMKEIIAKRTH
ncbi:MAG: hypothetical protein HY445_01245 [Candidatus Niyogibacteria bacterium]|nr:hypothetical protein [Candidatus Niyogibacteria bacterium]